MPGIEEGEGSGYFEGGFFVGLHCAVVELDLVFFVVEVLLLDQALMHRVCLGVAGVTLTAS